MRIKCPTTNNDPLIGIIDPVCAGAVCIRGVAWQERKRRVPPSPVPSLPHVSCKSSFSLLLLWRPCDGEN